MVQSVEIGNQIELVDGCPFNAALRGESKTGVLNWINILSLDAPVVALVWQGFFAVLFDVQISLAARFVLGLSVWLAYVADRWVDARMLPPGAAVTLRHQFAQRHSRAIAIAWVLVLVGNIMLALIGLSQSEFTHGLIVAALVFSYLAFIHIRSLRWLIGGTKEILVAFLFSAGSTVFIFANTDRQVDQLAFCAAIFFALCLINCVLVSSWERAEDAKQAQPSMAIHWDLSPVISRRIALAMMICSGIIAAMWWKNPVGGTAFASALSLALLVILEPLAARLSLNQRHVLADAALLTPAVLLLLG